MTKTLDYALFKKLLAGGAANLGLNLTVVNDLNVFPIPDGDTGENMMLTVNGGVRAVEGKTFSTLGECAGAAATGMLMSARGNSGVILSQFFAGLAKGLENSVVADVSAFGEALRSGVKYAYASVIKPTEGTILTVARESVEYALPKITGETAFEDFNRELLSEMNRSLARTPDLLPVLKEAGVIDSGGAGLWYIAEGASRTLLGEEIAVSELPQASAPAVDLSGFDENSVMVFGYCTEFLLRLTNAKTDIAAFNLDELIYTLGTMGDSIVAVRDGTIVKIHVHTMTPEKVLAYAHQFGEFLTLKIENMTLQHSDTTVGNRFEAKERKPFGLVTVASGAGLRQTFTDLGADVVIDGGQGKNPSTEDFCRAFDETNADVIFVLPNNGNIVMAAKQAASVYEGSRIEVIESKSIGEGYMALTMLSYESGDADAIADDLRMAMEGVVTGMVTRAVRTTTVDGISIREGDYIGFTKETMLTASESKDECAENLCGALKVGEHEYVILCYGKGADEADRHDLSAFVRSRYPRTELCEIDGGQDVYDFLIILP